jgi:hypothetical protein
MAPPWAAASGWGARRVVRDHTINRAARLLERTCVTLALVALAFRATLYWRMPAAPGASYGPGDVLDFALGLVLFALCCACAASGVALSLRGAQRDGAAMARAYRPVVIGMTSFVVYYFLHPHVPRLA